jgi:hypothetical protein
VDHAHETNANYSDPYHCLNSCIFKSLWFFMLPTVPPVLAHFSTFLVNSLKFSLRLNHEKTRDFMGNSSDPGHLGDGFGGIQRLPRGCEDQFPKP